VTHAQRESAPAKRERDRERERARAKERDREKTKEADQVTEREHARSLPLILRDIFVTKAVTHFAILLACCISCGYFYLAFTLSLACYLVSLAVIRWLAFSFRHLSTSRC